jgi:predicted MFS family arabinose efflux permease
MKPQSDAAAFMRPRLMLAMVTLVFVVNMLDRQIMGILLPQIRTEFHLSDTALGLLAGPTFAVIYSLMGVPLAMLADRVSRRNLIAAALALFSAATVLCGMAANFPQLLLARFGTGIGEAGTAPAINAMIADVYPPERRTGALSVYSAGANAGILLAFFGGGLLAQTAGWRVALMAAGIPGLVLAALFLVLVREPARVAQRQTFNPIAALCLLWPQPGFRAIVLGASLTSISGYAAITFMPSFLTRSHHMRPVEIGITLALITGVLGFAGTALPGLFADRRGDAGFGLRISAIGMAIALPFTAIFYLSGNLAIAVAALTVPALVATSYLGPCMAAVQNMATSGMRAQATALPLLIITLVGLGVGPQAVGIISDALRPHYGEQSLRYALLFNIVPSSLAALCFWRASRSLKDSTPLAP